MDAKRKSPIGNVLALVGIWMSVAAGAAEQEPDGHTFDFRDAEMRTVIEAVGSMTGKNFLIDDAVNGRVTLIVNTPIPGELAYDMLESILQAEGYALVPSVDGNIIRVIPSSKAPTSGIPVGSVRGKVARAGERVAPGYQYFTLEWNGKPAPPERPDISNVANPTVLTLPGQLATIEIGQQIPYFEPADSDDSPTSAYKIVHKFVGMRIELAFESAGEGFAAAYLKVEQSRAHSRDKLDGVALDVSAPIIDARSFETHVTFELDSWVAFQYPDLGGGSIFVFMKVGKIPGDPEG